MIARGDVWWYEHPEAGRRPFLILTRTEAIPVLNQLIAIPTTKVARHIPTEVPLDEEDEMPVPCVLTMDNLSVIRKALCVERITRLRPEKMHAVCEALKAATAC